jgi:rhodanese-related sulfurtransferase
MMNGREGDSGAGGFGGGISADTRQRLQGAGLDFKRVPDSSSPSCFSNPFLAPSLEIRRGRQRHFGILSSQGVLSAMAPSDLHSLGYSRSGVAGRVDPQVIARELIQAIGIGARSTGFLPSGSPNIQGIARELIQAIGIGARTTGFLPSGSPNIHQGILGGPNEKTGEISTAELLEILAKGAVTVFDARTRFEYSIGHIPGALSVGPKPGTPMARYVSDVAEIARGVADRSSPIVVYCNGPFCGKSRRLGEDLVKAGFTNVRRYQLGTPMWRALVGPMEIEPEGIRYIEKNDQTAVFIDARSPEEFALGSLAGARNVAVDAIVAAKNDGRLPMDDFNTRVVVFGRDGVQALTMSITLASNGFNNVKLCSCGYDSLLASLR